MSTTTVTGQVPRSISRAPTPPSQPTMLDLFINILDGEEGPFASFVDPLSQEIRKIGIRALKETDEAFLEGLEECKETLRQVLVDPILLIPMSKPVVLDQDVSLIEVDEEGKVSAGDMISREATYQQDTLDFYQKYMDHYESNTRISYIPHALAQAVIELFDLFPNDPSYAPLDESIDPTSSDANEFMILGELSSLNLSFVSHDEELKNQKREETTFSSQEEHRFMKEEVARQGEERMKALFAESEKNLNAFQDSLKKSQEDKKVKLATVQDRLNNCRDNTLQSKEVLQSSKATVEALKEKVQRLKTTVEQACQHCEKVGEDYERETARLVEQQINRDRQRHKQSHPEYY